MNEIKVIAKKPGGPWYETKIENTLPALQKFVGGYIETFPVGRKTVIICNEEGKLVRLPYNCHIRGEYFVGNILAVGVKGEEFADIGISLDAWHETFGEEVEAAPSIYLV